MNMMNWKHLNVCKQMRSYLSKMFSTKYSFRNLWFNICKNRIWHKITDKGWYGIKPSQPTNQFSSQTMKDKVKDYTAKLLNKLKHYHQSNVLYFFTDENIFCQHQTLNSQYTHWLSLFKMSREWWKPNTQFISWCLGWSLAMVQHQRWTENKDNSSIYQFKQGDSRKDLQEIPKSSGGCG